MATIARAGREPDERFMPDDVERTNVTRAWLAGIPGMFSGVGLMLGTLFFAASLTPTLVPRTYLTQGVLAGASFAAGYGIGVLWRWLWAYMELPEPKERMRRAVNLALASLCVIVVVLFLWRAADGRTRSAYLWGWSRSPVLTR